MHSQGACREMKVRSSVARDRCMCSGSVGGAQVLGADGMLYQTTEDLLSVGHELNPSIEQFEASCFNGAPLPS